MVMTLASCRQATPIEPDPDIIALGATPSDFHFWSAVSPDDSVAVYDLLQSIRIPTYSDLIFFVKDTAHIDSILRESFHDGTIDSQRVHYAWGLNSTHSADGDCTNLYLLGEPLVDGSNVTAAKVVQNSNWGGYELDLTFDAIGTINVKRATTQCLNRLMPIVLKGRVISSPMVFEPISNGRVTIAGELSQAQLQAIAEIFPKPKE